MRVHIILTDGKEDGEGGHKQPKNRSLRIAVIGCLLGSPDLKKNHKMAPPHHQTLWKGGTRLIKHNKQNQASGVCQISLEL